MKGSTTAGVARTDLDFLTTHFSLFFPCNKYGLEHRALCSFE
jgi:hypothetical protein